MRVFSSPPCRLEICVVVLFLRSGFVTPCSHARLCSFLLAGILVFGRVFTWVNLDSTGSVGGCGTTTLRKMVEVFMG